MTASVRLFLFGITVFFFAAVLYAIYRGRGVRALLKIPFAALSFETKEPGSADKTATENEAQTVQMPDPTRVARPKEDKTRA